MRTTQLIKRILAESFPGVQFTVTRNAASSHESILVGYIDGPLSDQVESIIRKFKLGAFDPDEDIYRADGRKLVFDGKEVGLAEYCRVTRTQSPAARALLESELSARFGQRLASDPSFRSSAECREAVQVSLRARFSHERALPSPSLDALVEVPKGGDLREAIERSKDLPKALPNSGARIRRQGAARGADLSP